VPLVAYKLGFRFRRLLNALLGLGQFDLTAVRVDFSAVSP